MTNIRCLLNCVKILLLKIVQGDYMNLVFVYENQSTLNKNYDDSL